MSLQKRTDYYPVNAYSAMPSRMALISIGSTTAIAMLILLLLVGPGVTAIALMTLLSITIGVAAPGILLIEGIKCLQRLSRDNSPRSKPVAVLTDKQVVELDGVPKMAIGLASFDPSDTKHECWLEAMPLKINADIIAVQSTGGPAAHGQITGTVHRFLLVATSATMESALEYLDQCGVKAVPLCTSVFNATASHDWNCTHYIAKHLMLDEPLIENFKRLEADEHHTAMISVSANALTLSVALDVFQYHSTKQAQPTWRSSPRLTVYAVTKLKFAAGITEVPAAAWVNFRREEPLQLPKRGDRIY